MKKRKLTKQELQKRKLIEDKKFNRILLMSFGLLVVLIISFLVFYTYRCETTFTFRQYALYGKKIPGELVCMNGNRLEIHESLKLSYQSKAYYFCSQECYNQLLNNYRKVAFITDAVTGDTICKADALIGLKNRGKPEIVYFENEKTFNRYYQLSK